MKTAVKGLVSATLGLVAFGAMLFLPAGTFRYWQAWVFLAVFALSTWIPSVYLMLGIPLALGSYWGLLLVIPGLVVLILRIRDEEDLLTHELSGYPAYTQRVHYRLLPYVW